MKHNNTIYGKTQLLTPLNIYRDISAHKRYLYKLKNFYPKKQQNYYEWPQSDLRQASLLGASSLSLPFQPFKVLLNIIFTSLSRFSTRSLHTWDPLKKLFSVPGCMQP